MNCPTCNRKLANNARKCPSCQHDLVAHRKEQAFATLLVGVLVLVALVLVALIALSPGIIINGLRGRYKNDSRNLISAAVRDWQTWVVSLPFVIVGLTVLNATGIFEAIADSNGGQMRTRSSASSTSTASPQATVTPVQHQQLLKARKSMESDLQVAMAVVANQKENEVVQVKREEEAEIRALEIIRNTGDRAGTLAQMKKAREAGYQIEELRRQYMGAFTGIEGKYAKMWTQRREEIEKAYQAQFDAIMSGAELTTPTVAPLQSVDDYQGASPKVLSLEANGNGSPIVMSYSVVGISQDDVLNVRSGPGANFPIVEKLSNGYGEIRLVGGSVMNDTTEWVQIIIGSKTGWVVKQYLQSEKQNPAF